MHDRTPSLAPQDLQRQAPAATRVEILARRLRIARANAQLLQEDVAERIGVTMRSLTRWETGECEPGFSLLCALADVYGVSLDWLAERSPVSSSLVPGSLLVDEDVVETVRKLAADGGALEDLPAEMIRHPGVDYVLVVPNRARVVSIDQAMALDDEIQRHIDSLRSKRS